VIARVAPLRLAEIPAADAGLLRGRAGIRWIEPTVPRGRLGSEHAGGPSTTDAEWEFDATHSNLVPDAVRRAASAVTIAVVDTGADLALPELAAKRPIAHNAVTGTRNVTDPTGHGTFVASVAAGSTVDGAPLRGFGGDARLMVVRASRGANVFDDVDEAAGIVWAVDHGARIVNLSIGGASTSRAERAAVAYAIAHGVLLVAAAGNTGDSGVRSYPAALIGPHGLAVAATTPTGGRASFSTAAPYVSIAAPGVRVLGATIPDADAAEYPRAAVGSGQTTYVFGTGTSYASPQVAGAAALVWAADPSLTADQVVGVLERSASGRGERTSGVGFGLLDVAAAVALAERRSR
jgi:subtilisin family serine protease